MNLSYVKKIFLVIFLDLLAYSAIMPLLPILFLDSQFFLKSMQTAQKVILLGGLYAIYPLFQALCSPFWIKKADLLGRKRMLQISFLGNFIGYSISCCGVMTGFFGYFLIGNAIAGALGVNLSTMNALISDSTQGTRRVKYFGLVNLILGLAFALGPLLSSHLVPKVPHVETIALVLFIFAAFLALINLALVSSIKPPLFINEKDSVTSINLKLLKKEAFYPLCLIFLTTFGWYIFIKTFQIFLLKSGLYEPKDVLKFVAFYGLSTVLAQALFVTGIYKKIQYKLSLSISLLGLSLFMALFVIQPGFISVHIQILAIAFFQSMITPNLLGFFSQNHTKDVHGQMMSTHMGVVSSAKIVAPAVSGLIMAKSPSLSILSSSGIMLVCFILLPLIFKKDSKEVKQTP